LYVCGRRRRRRRRRRRGRGGGGGEKFVQGDERGRWPDSNAQAAAGSVP